MTAAELRYALLQRVGEIIGTSDTDTFFTDAEALVALNAAQNLFAFATLCLEAEGTLPVTSGTSAYAPATTLPYWILPLRVRDSSDAKIRPATMAELDALDPLWQTRTGTVSRYVNLGYDLLYVYKQATANLTVTYARSPVALALDADVPMIPEEHHQALVDGAIPLLRLKEGDGELAKTLPYFERFVAAIQLEAGRVRRRNVNFDHQPPELDKFDLSKLFKLRATMQRKEANSGG